MAELEKLYELTVMADVDELKQQATVLGESDVKLKPFVNKMQAYLEDYQIEELSEWFEGEMTSVRMH
ncbi:hypothetical protein QUF74_07345 [Candidatus Halobeggiatoa sp. HSG11]|nr:hypothetical protein [Candidatus Halobeggiatoa sp. HSG11]